MTQETATDLFLEYKSVTFFLDLKYSVIQDGDNHKKNLNLNIFCGNKQKKTVANLIKPYLSKDVPFITAKVDVPLSTD